MNEACDPIRSDKGDVLGYAIGTKLADDEALRFMNERFASMLDRDKPNYMAAPPAVMKALRNAKK